MTDSAGNRQARGRRPARHVRAALRATTVLALLATGAAAAGCGGTATRMLVPQHCSVRTSAGIVDLDPEQAAIATTIVATAIRQGVPRRAVTVAFAAALQESKLRNLEYGDRDSLGVFQQRPSQGWGTREQILDPAYAASRFFAALLQVPGFERMPIHQAAQRVQRSAYGPAYAQHEVRARILTTGLTGRAGLSAVTCLLRPRPSASGVGAVRAAVGHDWGDRTVRATGERGFTVRMGSGAPPRHVRAMAFWLVTHADALGLAWVRHAGKRWRAADDADHWHAAGDPGRATTVDAVLLPRTTASPP